MTIEHLHQHYDITLLGGTGDVLNCTRMTDHYRPVLALTQGQRRRDLRRLTLTNLVLGLVLVAVAACAPMPPPASSLRSETESNNTLTVAQTSARLTPTDSTQAAAVFEGTTTTLLLPKEYRQWVFVGSSLGLNYGSSPSDTFNHVYIDPVAYKEYARTGTFPEGTVMILELLTAETKQEPKLHGTIEVDFDFLEASVKDSVRFPGEGWGYYGFGKPEAPAPTAEPNPPGSCWKCHDQKAETDHVFTQFYPILRAARPR